MMKEFIGREQELKTLNWYLGKRSASFITIRGRRRIGKTRLIREFGAKMRCAIFSGLPPDRDTTRQAQLDIFAAQLSKLFNTPLIRASDWGDMFWHLGQLTEHGRIVLVFDEISWMGSKDPMFLGQLKDAWDRHFSKNPKLIFIVCGSVSSWITKNILSSTGFVGRISYDMNLRELSLRDASVFWGPDPKQRTPFEMLKVLAVTGGVPRYLEELRPELSAEENVRHLCFLEGGLLVREFEQIFSDLFDKRAPLYEEIARTLVGGARSLDEVADALGRTKGGVLSAYMNDLLHAGFIAEDHTWHLKTEKESQLKNYRLCDNYLRFYLQYIEPRRRKIAKSPIDVPLLSALPNWESVVGLQFENLVINNVQSVLRVLRIDPSELSMFGPFFQRPTKRHQGCQIDLLIQTRHRVLYLCEIKFSVNPVGLSAVHQLVEKRRRISVPRGYATRTVLIHVNGITQPVLESQEIDHIVDFSDLLDS